MYINVFLAMTETIVSVEKSAHVDTLISVCQDFYDNIKDIDFKELDGK